MFSAERVAARPSPSASPLRLTGMEGLRRRKLSPPSRNQASQRTILQTKLSVNEPGDRFEQEADRTADQVMRMRESAPAPPPLIQRMCAECEEEVHRKENVSGPPSASGIQLPRGSGQPLAESARAFYEPRFGQRFDHVRVHTGSEAHESASSLNALAYTFGSNIVFAEGHYSADTDQGRRLLAHELTHVIQQGGRDTSGTIQRSCGAAVSATPGCAPDPSISPPATRFLFNVNCDDFAPGLPPFASEEGRMDAYARAILPTATVNLVGLASFDGDPRLNERLACSRAQRGLAVVRRSAPSGVTIASVNATVGGPASTRDPNMRAVGVDVSVPVPVPKCGPEATDWFVLQMNTAMSDPAVLSVQSDMLAADTLARSRGTTASVIAEAGATVAVEAQEARLRRFGPPPPARAGAIVGQLAAGATSERAAVLAPPAALAADPLHPVAVANDFATITALLASAALKWRALVNHKARYDFKMHADSMHMPHTAACPDPACPPGEHGTITLCHGSAPENCYETDLPGNLFYARIGRHIGFSELTLQLGSQLAELTDLPRPGRPVITWDTPDDTAAITLGFALPLPLTRTAFCAAIGPARSTLAARTGCDDCPDRTPSIIR